ncbi:MAG: hypothetical protein GY758_07365 [Fuerstiella sp.]|nr:hypothetical protein [Fuerstiella sp.]MCP4787607.1 hypothetical protein [Fuerstiella sp.]
MLKLKLLAGCVLACSLCFGAVGCGSGSIDNTAPIDEPDGGDPAMDGDADTDTDASGPEGTE